jgi:hypothetical protein
MELNLKGMSNSNEIVAKKIDDKLKEAGLISGTEKRLMGDLAKGNLKDYDWKVALEEIINKEDNEEIAKDEAE